MKPIFCGSLNELVDHRAAERPEALAYGFLEEGSLPGPRLSYAELKARVGSLAALLRQHAAPGDRALLLVPAGLAFVTVFLACLRAGVVAVPVPAPHPARLKRMSDRLQAVAADCGASVVLAEEALVQVAGELHATHPALARCRWLNLSRPERGGRAWQKEEALVAAGSDIALLQYTSGSTMHPRGVMVTHDNLLANLEAIEGRADNHERSVSISWLPPFHDMGLVGGILQPLYGGYPGWLMTPAAFLQRPIRWLQAISTLRGTFSGGPNFAFELCVRRTTSEQRAELDLSSWEYAFNGAEPVRATTMETFSRAFAPAGFRSAAWRPVYGLAEATLMVSGGKQGAPARVRSLAASALEQNQVVNGGRGDRCVAVVACGPVVPGTEVLVVDPVSGERCADGAVGELWVRGPGVARGYWQNEEATCTAFEASLAGDGGGGLFLRTGDLGFVDDGEVFVTGRLKDLLILRGRKLYPQDIEHTVEHCHPALRSHGSAACTVAGEGEEEIAVAAELRRGAGRESEDPAAFRCEVIASIRQAVSEVHEVALQQVLLLRPGGLPRTTSGKVQRRAAARLFDAGEGSRVAGEAGKSLATLAP